jgi:hypothetical protein
MARAFRSVLVLFGALALAPSALAAFPGPLASQGGTGLASLDGSLHFVAVKAGGGTRVDAVSTDGGATAMSRTVPGSFGTVQLTPNGRMGGLFDDGSAFVLQNTGIDTISKFLILDTRDLSTRAAITLKGVFGFDALSPDGSRLYLIQHTSTQDIQHYIVRAYDLKAHALLRGRVADRTQRSWVMKGWAVDRAATADGRWAYTLYANPGGFPFIHALDTVRGVAHCIGLPWTAVDQSPVYNFSLAVKDGAVVVHWQDGRVWGAVDTKTWRITR